MQKLEIRADYNNETIVLYQEYNDKIAVPAIKSNKFVEPFSFNRMTWIKPSFLWSKVKSRIHIYWFYKKYYNDITILKYLIF